MINSIDITIKINNNINVITNKIINSNTITTIKNNSISTNITNSITTNYKIITINNTGPSGPFDRAVTAGPLERGPPDQWALALLRSASGTTATQ